MAEFRKLPVLIRSELHLDPNSLTNEEFIERSRDVLWLLDYKEKRAAAAMGETIKSAVIQAYIAINNPQEQ